MARRTLRDLFALGLISGLLFCSRAIGPRQIIWDRETCAHCHMLISDPAFAAQLVTASGETPAFDDPGCLLAYLADRKPQVEAVYFHHLREDRWIPGDRVAFVAVPRSPMGYGLGAVDADTPGAMSLEDARNAVADHDALLRGRP